MTRRTIMLPLAVVATAAVALPIASGGAQDAPTTLNVSYTGSEKSVTHDAAPRTMRRGKLSLGDGFVFTRPVRVGGKSGTLQLDATVTNRTPTGFSKFTALVHGTLRTSDGDLYFIGVNDAAGRGNHSAIVGGSGAYAGARGNVVADERGAVITLGS